MVSAEAHPELEAYAFSTELPVPLGDMPAPPWLVALLSAGGEAPLSATDEVRAAVRDLLRHGGYKPTGRGKPASEYLVRAAAESSLRSINAAVDACNVVSLHSGLPISVVDLDRAAPPLRVGAAAAGSSYVFNASGQEIRLDGLLCLHDSLGPCANAVKDSERTKTHEMTLRTLSVIWGCRRLAGRAAAAGEWYREILGRLPARTEEVRLVVVQ
ncbi:MAG: phenylalanine--tRNA ligase beta subunit-related protein [Candidatus Eiseniibacteriota bacterium]